MSHEHKHLHLPNLSIKRFRGIDSLSIKRLGRVTLLAGRNGVGKTTVLEAVRVFAARGKPSLLHELLKTREEYSISIDEDEDRVLSPNFKSLFHGRTVTKDCPITIGPISGDDTLSFRLYALNEMSSEQRKWLASIPTIGEVQAIQAKFRDRKKMLPWLTISNDPFTKWPQSRFARHLQRGLFDEEEWPAVNCESLGPGLPKNEDLARFWDSVALTEEEDFALQALRLVNNTIDRVVVIGDQSRYSKVGRRVMVKYSDQPRPVPLKSLGDGVTRIFAAGLVLSSSRDGFLVIDEVENGIHYSVLPDFWRMILRSAHHHNVQVLATTHSLDCVKSFAIAANEIEESEGVLVRLDQNDGQTRAVEYSEEELGTVAEQNIEVR